MITQKSRVGISFLILAVILILISCSEEKNHGTSKAQEKKFELVSESKEIKRLMEEFHVTGVGIGIIENGVLTKTSYYGEQSPNVPVSKNTMFNVASVTKAVTAETFLRLVAKGEVSLDEPISAYYVHADLVDDPRHELLTPRMILTHKTGFRNWPWLYEDEKLAFDNDPGTKYGYSGIGFYILGKFLEEKLWVTFPHIVEQTLFEPLEMKNTSIVRESWFKERCPIPVDAEGNYMEEYSHEIGYWNPADDLHVSVEDYAKFLISSMNNEGLTDELVKLREEIHVDLSTDEIWGTNDSNSEDVFPPKYGQGIGWMVFDYGDGNKNIQHGGNDRGEAAMGYFHTKSKNGAVVFCNGGNAVRILPKLVELVDKEQKYTSVYNHMFRKFFSE